MGKQSAYMKSKYPRIPNDYYPTLDTRCVDGLLAHFSVTISRCRIVDMCSPSGSAIVDYLTSIGFDAHGASDAFEPSFDAGKFGSSDFVRTTIGITNPPYTKSLVDPIMRKQIGRVEAGQLHYFAALLRTNFDHAKTRLDMFGSNPNYWGQIKLLFRPWWSESRKHMPFHQYVWHVFTHKKRDDYPRVAYYDAPFDPKYAIDPQRIGNVK
jgi:hypothetical protein